MNRKNKKLISIVASALNEEENLTELYKRIKKVMLKLPYDFEIIFVDNGSIDKSFEVMKSIHQKDKRVKCLSLSRKFDHQEGLLAGIDHSKGMAVITMDSDLQHPPELIPEMIKLWEAGNKIVYTIKTNYRIPFYRLIFTKFYYYLISKLSGLKLSFGESDFRLIDRQVVDVLCSMEERPKFLRGLVEWVGFKKAGIGYEVQQRFKGKSSYTFFFFLTYGLKGILSFSILPLRFFLFTGLSVALFCILFALFYIVMKILSIYYKSIYIPPGWTSIVVGILFLSSIQLIGIGLLGEYIGRIYEQVKKRPEYIIKEKYL